jgi:Leucine Rich repeat
VRDYDYLTSFDGVPVVEFEDEAGTPPPDGEFAWAVRTEAYDGEEFGLVFGRFLASVDPATVTRLVIGCWGELYDVDASVPRDLLVEAAPNIPGLKALYFGDIAWEEAEISWIEQCDITPLLRAYPGLERLDVHGAAGNRENGEPGLRLSPVRAPALRVLRFESGGLPAGVVRAVGASDLPSLETLEMWLGVSEYGGDATIADLAGILSGERLPSLRKLGLMDSEIQDEICAAVATAPVVARLSELDLSMGTLGDEGAEALLSGQPLTHLRKLNLEHHFMTEPMVARLREAIPGVWAPPLKRRRGDEDGDWRYVAVAE